MVARLARRPWRKKEKEESEVKRMVDVWNMKETELRKIVRMVMTSFDGTPRSIARRTIKLALKERDDVVWATSTVRSSILGGHRSRKLVECELRRW